MSKNSSNFFPSKDLRFSFYKYCQPVSKVVLFIILSAAVWEISGIISLLCFGHFIPFSNGYVQADLILLCFALLCFTGIAFSTN